jgi:hypothetical protein
MRKVVDRNFLQSPTLLEYLSASRKNHAVLCDYTLMEALKGDTVANISSATAILAAFPKQVVVLKSTAIICQLKGRRCGFTRRMIDKGQTKGLPEWREGLGQAQAGDNELRRQLLAHGKEADAHLNRILNDQTTYAENLDRASKHYTAAELKALRAHEPIPEAMFLKLLDNILDMAAFLFDANPNISVRPPSRELPYTFIFRYALAGYLLALRWMSVGGAKKVKPERIRNDIVDATLAAYATYFQGLLSNDVKANEIYHDAKSFLKVLLAGRTPPDHIAARLVGKTTGG